MTQDLKGVLSLDFVGGYLCLDFANTVHSYDIERPSDELQTYADLVLWSRRIGTIDEDDAERLLAEATAHPRRANSVLNQARSLRRLVFDVFSSVSDGKDPTRDHLKRLSETWAQAMRHGRITTTPEGYKWGWGGSPSAMDRMLWPIVRSAVELLTSKKLRKVRKCVSNDCTWLFIDKSKNLSRRWCEMDSCGNRAKSRRHYRRTRIGGGGPGHGR
jgi:predicted RNA-binding Zn ribbon-like protein